MVRRDGDGDGRSGSVVIESRPNGVIGGLVRVTRVDTEGGSGGLYKTRVVNLIN